MTLPPSVLENDSEPRTSIRDIVERYRPVFDEIGAGAVARENERRLPFAEVELLRASGFTRVTLPRELGGDAVDHLALFELLAELARRDPNVAQLLRSHFAFIDRTLHGEAPPTARARLARIAAGAIYGNATFERGSASVGSYATTLTRDERGQRPDGRKFYSTGTLFADVVGVLATPDATTGLGPDPVSVLVATDAPGLTRVDDWDGFGQRMTGSGSTIFDGVRVAAGDVLARAAVPGHAGAFVQLVLLAALTGIGRAVVDDAARFARERTRSYSHASADRPRHDPIVQEVVGDLSAASFAADAALTRAVTALQRAAEAQHPHSSSGEDDRTAAIAAADLATAQAQLVVIPAVLRAATDLFEVGGASALGESLALDRHWRNARALSSHNPARYKARIVGDHLINSTPIVAWWTSGEA
ncbi:hypothetical protein QSU92_05240 [Microbacterium sp. ET2]|uniref:hypothetical protein n=1 Tax=Microbacterium albipurpureum TaxID=3050384 RepID=UPI00259CBAD8|nr:hypothetical protein [Microbacterium sp. ET2 (Ac-2212)]WJL96584.1 hypothetical protein QSU92_05240 [Microbacterium sp. ET2 (Ac-2212)]